MREEPAEPARHTGLVVGEKFRVGRMIGQGGMGIVYEGTDEVLGGVVAIKFLRRMYASDPALRERFRREAKALSRLRHPAIVSLLHFGEHATREGDEVFMVMERIDGEPLSQLIDRGPLSLALIGRMFGELLEVLALAHAADIVHRDIKPSNVMVVTGDRIKLLDFGLAHLPEGQPKLTVTGIAHGTPEYMSPEQSQGEPVGPPSDIYSAAMLLYECVAGVGPFDGVSGAMHMAQHLFVEPPPMKKRGHKRDVGDALEDLVARGLAKRPEDRPTAQEMRDELTAIFKGTDPISLARSSAESRTRDALLGRNERALTGRPAPIVGETQPETVLVEIHIADEKRAAVVRSALGVARIRTVVAVPGQKVGAESGAVIVSAHEGLAVMPEMIAAHVPVLVIDVTGARETRDAIRAGASDIVLAGADAKIAGQVSRLLRRKR